jgi:hypothetical protein
VTDLFISYAHEDKPVIRELVKILEDRDWSVWWDRDIDVGAEFATVIERALLSAACVLVIWSENSVASPWVRAEAQEAMSGATLLPVCMDDTTPPLPFRLLESANLAGWPDQPCKVELEKLLLAIGGKLNAEKRPEERTEPVGKVRSDPTLSTRVAQHVVDRLNRIDSTDDSSNTDIGLERAIADYAVALLREPGNEKSSLRQFTTRLGELWSADFVAVAEGTRLSLVSDRVGVSEPQTLVAAGVIGVQLDSSPASGVQSEPDMAWRLTIGDSSGKHILLAGTAYDTRPQANQLERLESVYDLVAGTAI